jgi:aminomethyltransferase
LIDSLQRLVPSDLQSLQPGASQYTVFLNEDGGILDDLIFYYQGEDAGIQHGVLIVNAATCAQDKIWLTTHLVGSEVELEDCTHSQVLLAVQGPQAMHQLQAFVQDVLISVGRFEHLTGTVLGQPGFLARTGYTGEDGFEVMVAPEVGVELWRSLVANGVMPCGLGARDTLRLEAAMALYGQDIDQTTTPLEAGLGWLVHLDRKGDFIGRSALERQQQEGISRKLVGLVMEGRNIARHDYPVVIEGQTVGKITSGTWSPTLGKAIALAYVPHAFAKINHSLRVEIRGKLQPGTIVKRPFYKRGG